MITSQLHLSPPKEPLIKSPRRFKPARVSLLLPLPPLINQNAILIKIQPLTVLENSLTIDAFPDEAYRGVRVNCGEVIDIHI